MDLVWHTFSCYVQLMLDCVLLIPWISTKWPLSVLHLFFISKSSKTRSKDIHLAPHYMRKRECWYDAFNVTLISRWSQYSSHEGEIELWDVESVTWGRGRREKKSILTSCLYHNANLKIESVASMIENNWYFLSQTFKSTCLQKYILDCWYCSVIFWLK